MLRSKSKFSASVNDPTLRDAFISHVHTEIAVDISPPIRAR